LAQARTKIANLETALLTARRIGTAVGIVMVTYKVPADAAFDLLVMVSQQTHRKVRDVAEDVIEVGDLVDPALSRPDSRWHAVRSASARALNSVDSMAAEAS
jgi:hypothetical protein